MNCGPPGSSVHGISQARILEWIAMPSSWGSSRPRNQTHISFVSCTGKQILYHWATRGLFTSGPAGTLYHWATREAITVKGPVICHVFSLLRPLNMLSLWLKTTLSPNESPLLLCSVNIYCLDFAAWIQGLFMTWRLGHTIWMLQTQPVLLSQELKLHFSVPVSLLNYRLWKGRNQGSSQHCAPSIRCSAWCTVGAQHFNRNFTHTHTQSLSHKIFWFDDLSSSSFCIGKYRIPEILSNLV